MAVLCTCHVNKTDIIMMCTDNQQVAAQETSKSTLSLDTPIHEDHVRFVCISDTHTQAEVIRKALPPGDVLIHTGDFSQIGSPNQIDDFNTFIGKLPHRHKIVIAGNHELSFDEKYMNFEKKRKEVECSVRLDADYLEWFIENRNISSTKELLTNCVYLQDSEVIVCGLRIYGSPWTEDFCDWAFSLKSEEDCIATWNRIPSGIDVLLTHGPPYGQRDHCVNQAKGGCWALRDRVKQVKPKYHVFGHIHEDYGISKDDHTVYINASTCSKSYKPINPPVIFDLPLPPGCTKDDLHFRKTAV